jgi:trk system potassium uptake protein TrkH
LGAEFNNHQTLGGLSLPHKILNALFQSVTARTAGFNTINTGSLFLVTLLFVMILMFIGGASGSTAGGIKVNTAGILLATVWNTIRGREHPGAFQREFLATDIPRNDSADNSGCVGRVCVFDTICNRKVSLS